MKKPNTTQSATAVARRPDSGFAYSRAFFEELVDSALAHAKKLGASDAGAEASEGCGLSVSVRKGELENVERNRDKSLGVTVYMGHRRGNASTSDFSAAAIEQNHDARGIIWPDALAPFTVVLCPISPDRFPEVKAAADKLYGDLLAAGVDVILDDRGERPGAMFADWELIGVPHRVNIGDRGLKDGQVEYQQRRDASPTLVAVTEIFALLKSRLKA